MTASSQSSPYVGGVADANSRASTVSSGNPFGIASVADCWKQEIPNAIALFVPAGWGASGWGRRKRRSPTLSGKDDYVGQSKRTEHNRCQLLTAIVRKGCQGTCLRRRLIFR